ncbi:hypothetical protein QQF64_013864 [Cirrhinus molitorella]|uniref:Uncharacterized protein n=1 Tax=Cirrhinus molitorella TaxID=172907 RepID=A0ABR3LSD0_9TELE
MCRQRTAKMYLYHDKETVNAMAQIWKARCGEGEWQRSGYRRRVFFSSQTHCGTARRLEWRHRSSQLQSTGLFRGGREAEHFLSKYHRSAPFCH